MESYSSCQVKSDTKDEGNIPIVVHSDVQYSPSNKKRIKINESIFSLSSKI